MKWLKRRWINFRLSMRGYVRCDLCGKYCNRYFVEYASEAGKIK